MTEGPSQPPPGPAIEFPPARASVRMARAMLRVNVVISVVVLAVFLAVAIAVPVIIGVTPLVPVVGAVAILGVAAFSARRLQAEHRRLRQLEEPLSTGQWRLLPVVHVPSKRGPLRARSWLLPSGPDGPTEPPLLVELSSRDADTVAAAGWVWVVGDTTRPGEVPIGHPGWLDIRLATVAPGGGPRAQRYRADLSAHGVHPADQPAHEG